MKQAPGFDDLSFDPSSLFQNGLTATEVGIRGCLFADAVAIASVIAMFDEGLDGPRQGSRQASTIQLRRIRKRPNGAFTRRTVLQRLMPALDLSLGPWVIRYTAHLIHLSIVGPVIEISGDVTGPVVAEQPGFCRTVA